MAQSVFGKSAYLSAVTLATLLSPYKSSVFLGELVPVGSL